MQLTEAKKLALSLMKEHKLDAWNFTFDTARRRFGCCDFKTKTISLSATLVKLNDLARVRNTILHEIAHALSPFGSGHSRAWEETAKSIGCDGARLYNAKVVVQPQAPYTTICSAGHTGKAYRKPKRESACGVCCRAHNEGKFSKKYILTYKRNK